MGPDHVRAQGDDPVPEAAISRDHQPVPVLRCPDEIDDRVVARAFGANDPHSRNLADGTGLAFDDEHQIDRSSGRPVRYAGEGGKATGGDSWELVA